MHKQSVSDSPRVKGNAVVFHRLAPGQPDPKKNTEAQSLYIYIFLRSWNQCFLLCLWAENISSGISSGKEVIRSCPSTVSSCTFYQDILIFQVLCKGACCTISSRAHVLNLSVVKSLISSASPIWFSGQQYSQAKRLKCTMKTEVHISNEYDRNVNSKLQV